MSEMRNAFVAIALSLLVVFGWDFLTEKFFPSLSMKRAQNVSKIEKEEHSDQEETKKLQLLSRKATFARSNAIEKSADHRLSIENKTIKGSILLKGLIFDDITFKEYKITNNKNSENVHLLSPDNSKQAYYVKFGWRSEDASTLVPDDDSIWKVVSGDILDINRPLTLIWENGEGLTFRVKISLDSNYMFKIKREVVNLTNHTISLMPFGEIFYARDKELKNFFVSHEGFIGSVNGIFKDLTYKKIYKNKTYRFDTAAKSKSGNNWLGLSDKYWFTALIPEESDDPSVSDSSYMYFLEDSGRGITAEFDGYYYTIPKGESKMFSSSFFAGAKELRLLDKYSNDMNIALFDRAVDFGLFYVITKPLFLFLEFFYLRFNNFGFAIILLTVLIKLALMPLSSKSYYSMLKIKALQPKINKIKEENKSNPLKANKEVAELFKKNSVSPLSGILPTLLQVPVLFSLYKVLFVTIEMRHAPFMLWIKDLSAQDSSNLFNLFGLIDFDPGFSIGILPILLGFSIFIQQNMAENKGAASEEAKQSKALLKAMPVFFTFIFASFPTGLLIYWLCGNIITSLQQYIITHIFKKKQELFSVKMARV